jgi:hypothetical protein
MTDRATTRNETVALCAAILGFVVDAITMIGFLTGRLTAPFSIHLVAALSLPYGWFVAAWIVVRRHYLTFHTVALEERPTAPRQADSTLVPIKWNFKYTVFAAVSSIGVLVAPLVLLVAYPWLATDGVSLLVVMQLALVGVAVFVVVGHILQTGIKWLMPLVYGDMRFL